ncbi:MAG: cytochrome c4 [Methylobacter sp.]
MKSKPGLLSMGFFCLSYCLATDTALAGLTDVTQTSPHVAGSAIGKSLEQQIGAGQGNEITKKSSIYLIKRDPARSIRRGRELFQRKFTVEQQGLGPRVNFDSSGDIQENPALGAGLTDSCAACHGRPRGSGGVGGEVATRPDSRDAPHLFGLGLVEMLGDEITQHLRAIRTKAQNQAIASKRSVVLPLYSKGINYGFIKALPDGTLDASGAEGIDADLRVRPFFAQGGEFSMRTFIVGAFKDEMGLEAFDPVLCSITEPDRPAITTPAGLMLNPSLDKIKPPPVCSATEDGDGDGVANEIDAALVDHMEFYLLNYFKPGTGRTTRRTKEGLKLMHELGCTTCHIQNLRVQQDRRVADLETRFDPERGLFNRLFAKATPLFKVVNDGQTYPKLLPRQKSFLVRNIFADFKRHDLGPAFHERNYDGTLLTETMTEPLWGVATTAPYGHDGRSINLEEVILRHGGEAQAAKEAFEKLDDNNRSKVLEFLSTLILFPPDDTASTLNPGHPDTDNPQDPSQHGSINLGAWFQIPYEGPE